MDDVFKLSSIKNESFQLHAAIQFNDFQNQPTELKYKHNNFAQNVKNGLEKRDIQLDIGEIDFVNIDEIRLKTKSSKLNINEISFRTKLSEMKDKQKQRQQKNGDKVDRLIAAHKMHDNDGDIENKT